MRLSLNIETELYEEYRAIPKRGVSLDIKYLHKR